jgi:hypothetical protein
MKVLLTFVAALLGSAPAWSCELKNVLSGEIEIATVKNQLDGEPDYETFLIRNAARGTDGVLNSFIKGELVPERWGFDLRNVHAEVVGQMYPDGTIDDFKGEPSCKDVKLTFRFERARVVFEDQGKRIGSITGKFPRSYLKR